jgi:hypothetical protein
MTNGKPRLVVLFTNAVRYGAAAELFEHSTDMTATGAMQGREEAKRQQGAILTRGGFRPCARSWEPPVSPSPCCKKERQHP